MLSCPQAEGSEFLGHIALSIGAFLYAFMHSRGFLQSTSKMRFGVTCAPVEQKLAVRIYYMGFRDTLMRTTWESGIFGVIVMHH